MIGPLLAMGVADAYAVAFEFAPLPFIKKNNHMEGYSSHPKFKRPKGTYSDDTQMASEVVAHMITGQPWTPYVLAERWVRRFHLDPRTGFAQHFYDFLQRIGPNPYRFLKEILPHSAKNGGAMRAFPVGFLPAPGEVRDKAMFQASLTHATYEGMVAAAAAALTFHFCYYEGKRDASLGDFLSQWLPGIDWEVGLTPRGEPTGGVPTVQKAIAVLKRCQSLTDAIQMAAGLGGDTDTIAAIAAPCAAVCPDVRNVLPDVLLDGLEGGEFGKGYLEALDRQMMAMYPRDRSSSPAPEPEKPTSKTPKNKKATPAVSQSPVGFMDFLFENEP